MNLKIAITLFIVSLLSIGCNIQRKNNITEKNISKVIDAENIQKIELTERTRGTNRLITFSQNTLTVNLNGTDKISPLTSQEWKNIIQEATFLNLEKISTYESPTTGRYSDAALASTIIITANGKTYSSADFDSGKPPVELKEIYNKLKEPLRNFTQSPQREIKMR